MNPNTNMPQTDPVDQASARSTADYRQFIPAEARRKRKFRKVLGWAIIGLIALALLAAAGYGLGKLEQRKPKSASPAQTTNQTQQPTQQSTKITDQTKQFTATGQSVSFNYPVDWAATENGTTITVKSPGLQLTDASGQKVTGQITMTVRPKQTTLPEFSKGNAQAVRASEKIAYTSPTTSQRGNTYVSYLQYASTNAAGALDGVYITGDAGYLVGQAIPLVDVAKADPLVTITFAKCADSSCASVSPLSIQATSWDDSSLSAPLETMLKSLKIS